MSLQNLFLQLEQVLKREQAFHLQLWLLQQHSLRKRRCGFEQGFLNIPASRSQIQPSTLLIISSAFSIVALKLCCSACKQNQGVNKFPCPDATGATQDCACRDGSHLISLHEIRVQLLFHLMTPNLACSSEEVVSLFKFSAE